VAGRLTRAPYRLFYLLATTFPPPHKTTARCPSFLRRVLAPRATCVVRIYGTGLRATSFMRLHLPRMCRDITFSDASHGVFNSIHVDAHSLFLVVLPQTCRQYY